VADVSPQREGCRLIRRDLIIAPAPAGGLVGVRSLLARSEDAFAVGGAQQELELAEVADQRLGSLDELYATLASLPAADPHRNGGGR